MNAYAKINLTLDVLSRRPDGYHDIDSIFQTVSLADAVELKLTDDPGVSIEVDGPESTGVPSDSANLAVRAATELLATAEPDAGATIRLTKQIPSQAGLGGGSSDAAAVLRRLSELLAIDLRSDLIAEVAKRLGADVPFFLTGGTARVRGLGDRVDPLDDIAPLSLLIARPAVAVSTANAYRALDAAVDRIPGSATAKWPAAGFGNDFAAVVYRLYPAIAETRDALLGAGCRSVTLCGSGSCVFGIVDNPESALAAVIAAGCPHVWAAETVGRNAAMQG